jgi:amino acid adenylation domain-containing protein
MTPLSFAQRRLWFVAQLEGPAATYNVPYVVRLSGPLDARALEGAVNDVVARHESLRTVFADVDGEPQGRILSGAQARVEMQVCELDQADVDEAIERAASLPFDLAREIPVRAALFRVGEHEHVLLLLVHHIACDGWSGGPLSRDLSAAYRARVEGGAPEWVILPVQYADYAMWQRDLLGDAGDPDSVLSRQLDFWRQRLAGIAQETRLPADRTRPAVSSGRGAVHEFALPAAVHRRLRQLARERRATMFMVVHAAVAALMARLGAGSDVTLGTMVAGRGEAALDDLVGFFVNTVVLRVDVSGDPSFGELLERVRGADLDAFAHQDVPFERLVEELNPVRSANRHPLFQVSVSAGRADGAWHAMPGLETEWSIEDGAVARFDLSFGVDEAFTADGRPAGLKATIRYAADLFDRETVVSMATCLTDLLTAVSADPALEIGRIAGRTTASGSQAGAESVESVLCSYPDVESVVVLMREEPSGQRRPAAYVWPAPGGRWDASDLRTRCERDLPAHLVPAFISVLGSPSEAEAEPESATSNPNARSAHEDILCGLFAEVLGVERVGVHDDFFAHSGHSLLVVRLVSRIRAVLGCEIGVSDVFRAPTVSALARRLRPADAARPVLERRSRTERMPLSFAQRRLWFLAQLEGPAATYNVPYVVRLSGALDAEALEGAINDVVARHESLRTVFGAVDGEPWARVLSGAAAQVVVERREASRMEVDEAVARAASRPFDLAREIPVRAWLFRVTADEHVLLLLLHHIACDGWSGDPLSRDLSAAYQVRHEGGTPAWGAQPVQYADYAIWQRELLGDASDADSVLSRQLDFWRERLAGAPRELRLPLDRTRPAASSGRGGMYEFELSADLHRRLAALARVHQVTMFMVVHAAVAVVLNRLGAGTDLPLGTAVAGRDDQALDDLVGFFVNTLVLRVDVSGDPSFGELLERVRGVDLDALAHQDVPFDRLVEELNPVRSANRHPLFQVSVSAGRADGRLHPLPGLRTEWGVGTTDAAKFDLAFGVEEAFTADREPVGMKATVRYAQDLFDRATVAAMAACLGDCLEAVCAHPEVKINGVLGDPDANYAEAVLSSYEDVEYAVVLAHEEPAGERRLAAYVTPVPGSGLSEAAFRSRCERDLPAHLVPRVIRMLDRPAPQEPEPVDPAGANARSAQEEILCGLFADVLDVDRVGVNDNFFALGGNSLLVTRIVGRVRAALACEIGVRDLFHAPTVFALARRLRPADAARPELRHLPRADLVPLSFAQRRLWFSARLAGPSSTYHVSHAVRLSGPLDVPALESALNDVVGRHESLRTVFIEADGEPWARVLSGPAAHVVFEVCEVARKDLDEAVARAASRPFDLAREIPIRAWLFRIAPDECVLLLLQHHIASDGWSHGPMARDLSAAYEARAAGGAPEWAALPVQYADYARWQRELLGDAGDADSVLSRQLGFWRERLAGAPHEVRLPADRARPEVASGRGGVHEFALSPDLHRRMDALARAHQVTMFMVVHAAVAVVLNRLGAGTDLPLGALVAARDDAALDDLVGFFVNTLVLRTDVSGDPSFGELLERVRGVDLDAFAHQDVPFDRLVEELNPVRSANRHPLFQVLFTLDEGDETRFALPGLRAHTDRSLIRRDGVKFDLDFGLVEHRGAGRSPAGISANIQYSADLFDQATAASIADRLVRVLEEATRDPGLRVGGIDVLGAAERDLLLRTWNDTNEAYPDHLGVHQLIEQQAERTPHAVAVVCGDTELTYAQLNARANRLARQIRAHGAAAGDLVAVCLERGADLIVALLGVLKSGAAYVPLDPDYPPQRLRFMLDDADPALVVTQTSVAGRSGGFGTRRYLCLDEARHVPADTDASDLEPAAGPDDLAYVIYTSGSTGTPKGVLIERRSMSNRLQEMAVQYALTSHDRTLQYASASFDAAAEQIFPTLIAGARIVLRDDEKWTPARIIREINRTGVTVAELTPSLWQQLIPHLESGDRFHAGFRLMVLGGEQVSPALAARWFKCGSVPLHNTYGPTETTITATSCVVTGPCATVAIGRPVANTEAYVMDEYGGLCPIGAPGELWIGGVGVARGYLGRPELTAQKFVHHPFAERPGARLYRTGDLVRRRADGEIEFLGRIDDQVKIRGFRVELGEIESVLAAHDRVAAAAVAVHGDGADADAPDDKRLVAYLVSAPGAEPDPRELRGWCEARLPDHMVPGWFVVLDALPLTVSGKVDRAALPRPQSPAGGHTAPRTELEIALAGIWADVLGLDRVGLDDDFFELGGHSLLAMQVVNRISLLTGLELGLREFFRRPTVEALAQYTLDLFAAEESGAEA